MPYGYSGLLRGSKLFEHEYSLLIRYLLQRLQDSNKLSPVVRNRLQQRLPQRLFLTRV
jgi:hypothetical protein